MCMSFLGFLRQATLHLAPLHTLLGAHSLSPRLQTHDLLSRVLLQYMGLQARNLHLNANILAAQVDALELRCSQSEALEKDMTDVLRIKDKQVGLEAVLQMVHRGGNNCCTIYSRIVTCRLTCASWSKQKAGWNDMLPLGLAADKCCPPKMKLV